MKQLNLIIALFSLTFGYGQSSTSEQNLELSETNITKLFDLQAEWTTCFDTDSAYVMADTIMLYSDIYFYLTTDCCYETSWTFDSNTTFNMSNTIVCQEPPLSIVNYENTKLKVRFVQSESVLTMIIYKNKVVKDEFKIVSLDYVELRKDQFAYRLTMVR